MRIENLMGSIGWDVGEDVSEATLLSDGVVEGVERVFPMREWLS
jgi:hypothetical protein